MSIQQSSVEALNDHLHEEFSGCYVARTTSRRNGRVQVVFLNGEVDDYDRTALWLARLADEDEHVRTKGANDPDEGSDTTYSNTESEKAIFESDGSSMSP